jgi:hypothetical protein
VLGHQIDPLAKYRPIVPNEVLGIDQNYRSLVSRSLIAQMPHRKARGFLAERSRKFPVASRTWGNPR